MARDSSLWLGWGIIWATFTFIVLLFDEIELQEQELKYVIAKAGVVAFIMFMTVMIHEKLPRK